jgi:AcrR family transcriptional regulator
VTPESTEPLAPLRRGRQDLAPEDVERHQLERLVAAVATVMAERGYGGLTVDRVIALARVSRTTFYRHFANRQEAVLGVYKLVFDRFIAAIRCACAAAEEWPAKVEAGLGAALDFAIAEPAQTQLLSAEFLGADPILAERVRCSHRRLVALLDEGRRHYPESAALPAVTEEALISGVATLVARALQSGEPERVSEMRPEIVRLILLPYLGTATGDGSC